MCRSLLSRDLKNKNKRPRAGGKSRRNERASTRLWVLWESANAVGVVLASESLAKREAHWQVCFRHRAKVTNNFFHLDSKNKNSQCFLFLLHSLPFAFIQSANHIDLPLFAISSRYAMLPVTGLRTAQCVTQRERLSISQVPYSFLHNDVHAKLYNKKSPRISSKSMAVL